MTPLDNLSPERIQLAMTTLRTLRRGPTVVRLDWVNANGGMDDQELAVMDLSEAGYLRVQNVDDAGYEIFQQEASR